MNLPDLKELYIDGIKLVKLFINGVQVWKSGYKNWVPYSLESGGASIYNGGLGYKDGYRLSSSGAEKTQDGSTLTGFIPTKLGDVIRMAGVTWGTTASEGYSYIQFYNSNFKIVHTVNRYQMESANGITNSGSTVDQTNSSVLTDSNGVTTFNIVFKIIKDYSYIRISADGNGADMIVTINEEIT